MTLDAVGNFVGKSIRNDLDNGLLVLYILLPILLLCSMVWWYYSEMEVIQDLKQIEYFKETVVSADCNSVDTGNEGKIVHMVGKLSAQGLLTDCDFQVDAKDVLQLRRTVHTYQWREHEQKVEKFGKDEMEYSYTKEWLPHIQSSERYAVKGHSNPCRHRVSPFTTNQETYQFGEFVLNTPLAIEIAKKMTSKRLVPPVKEIVVKGESGTLLSDGQIYFGVGTLKEPAIGDSVVSVSSVAGGWISVCGKQTGTSLHGFKNIHGEYEFKVQPGRYSLDELLDFERKELREKKWRTRMITISVCLFGFASFYGLRQIMTGNA